MTRDEAVALLAAQESATLEAFAVLAETTEPETERVHLCDKDDDYRDDAKGTLESLSRRIRALKRQ